MILNTIHANKFVYKHRYLIDTLQVELFHL